MENPSSVGKRRESSLGILPVKYCDALICSAVSDFTTPWTVAHQAPLSMELSRQEYWSGLPFLLPGDLPNPGIKARSPALQADSFPAELPGKPQWSARHYLIPTPPRGYLIFYTFVYLWFPIYYWLGNLTCSVLGKEVKVMSASLWPHGLYSPWNSPGQNTGVVVMPSSRGSSQLEDRTQVSCIAGGFFTSWATREAQEYWNG